MRRALIAIVILLAAYMASGVYIVGGNEKGVVRRFGQALRTEGDRLRLQPSGIHYDLPWPLAVVDRVNLNEVRTLSIGTPEEEEVESAPFLTSVDVARQSQFLTGDKNILNMFVNVHYRISEENLWNYLYGSFSPEARLRRMAEAALAEVVLRSGVDFVHTMGRNELRVRLISRLQERTRDEELGLDVDDVTIGGVYPPIRVKAQFLDVMNARADRITYVNEAQSYAEQRSSDGRAEARRKRDTAEIYRRQKVEEARGQADSFAQLVSRFSGEESRGVSVDEARRMAMQRRYFDVMDEILRSVKAKVFLDSGKPVDLTIFRDPSE